MYIIKLNSGLIFVLGLVLGPHPGPRPNVYFFLEKSLFITQNPILLVQPNLVNPALLLYGNLLFRRNFLTPKLYVYMYQLEKNTL